MVSRSHYQEKTIKMLSEKLNISVWLTTLFFSLLRYKHVIQWC